MHYAVIALCVLVLIAAAAGTVIPVVPSLPLSFLTFLGFGLYDDWQSYGLKTMIVVGAAVALTLALDQVSSMIGARKLGASKAGMIGSAVCAIIGLVFLSLPGLIIGAFAGAVAFEMIFSHQELRLAMKAGGGALLGLLVGTMFKFMLSVVLALSFVWLVLIA
jgi:uncharacterized protein YqgC (DUF456 family)